jgi:hypothetical protein
MPRVRFPSPLRCAHVLTAGWLLSGCLASAPPSGGTVNTVSSRQLASDLRLAAPPPSLADKAAPEPTFDDLDPPAAGGRLASHAAVSERIGPALSPRLAMAVAQARAASAPEVAAGQVAVPVQSPLPSPPLDTEVGAGIRAGQCWAQLVTEPVTRRQTVQVVTEDGGTRLHVQPPELRTQNRAVVVKEEAQTYRVEPPRFRQVTEQVKVKDEVRRLVVVPAVYEDRQESVMVESARVVLENCRASAQRAAGSGVASRQAKCAREVPARYQTVARRVLVQPESAREEVTPAVYTTITKWVLDAPARAVPETLPASTRQLPLTEVAQPAQVEAQKVEPTTAAVRVTQHEGMPQLVWRRALCESEAMPEVVSAIQLALRQQGMDVGPADGKLGRRTMAALVDFQRREGLAMGLVTFETLAKLGVPGPQH